MLACSARDVLRCSALAFALALAGCGGDSGTSVTNPTNNQPPPTQNANTDITIVQGAQTKTTAAFSPNPKTVSLGTSGTATVRWVNADIIGGDYTNGTATVHNIALDDGSYSTGNLAGNATASHDFTQAGTYPFHCQNHPNMVGTIEVTP
ncbi:MAG TPA: hypothetical protein VFK09_01785 [Gemmatimonadales bacterium]|jgi:plastocyanin|nr:hypothetical protein [Gemmatimonadales bacterium]